jgi:hypothetical protein
MNQFLLFAISVGFGALAWIMLVISDWLLAERPARPVIQRAPSQSAERLNFDHHVNTYASSRGIVPTARQAS